MSKIYESEIASKNLSDIVKIDERKVQSHLNDIVKKSVEETLNELLNKEAEQLCEASRYERNADRQGYRAGHYDRKLHTTAGEVNLKVPSQRRQI